MTTKRRRDYIDMLKGLSIVTLVYLHFENFFEYEYNYFLVRSTAFYFVVGWLWGLSSKSRTIEEHIQKRRYTLIYPYLWFSIIIIVFDIILVLLNFKEPYIIWRDIYKFLCLKGIGTLWFLPALLFGEIIFIYLRDKSLRFKLFSALLSLGVIYLHSIWLLHYQGVVRYGDIIGAPLQFISDINRAWLYIAAAYYLAKRYSAAILEQSAWVKIVVGLSFVGVYFWATNLQLLPPYLSFWAVNIVLNTLCIVGVTMLFTLVEGSLLARPLVYFGRNSLILMATHFSILLEIFMIIDKYIFGNMEYNTINTVWYFFAALAIEVLIINLINTKAPFLIRRKSV